MLLLLVLLLLRELAVSTLYKVSSSTRCKCCIFVRFIHRSSLAHLSSPLIVSIKNKLRPLIFHFVKNKKKQRTKTVYIITRLIIINYKMWQLTMYCHLRPPDAMPLLTLNVFEAPERQQPNVDGVVYIHYAAPHYAARISAIYLLPFNKVWLDFVCRVVCNAWQRNRTQIYGGWVKSPVLFYHVCGPKCTTFSDGHSNALARCLCHVSFRIYSPFSLEVIEKPNKYKSFYATIFGNSHNCLFLFTFVFFFKMKLFTLPRTSLGELTTLPETP